MTEKDNLENAATPASLVERLVIWIDAEKEKPMCQQFVLIAYTDRHGIKRITMGWYCPRYTLESDLFEDEVDDEYNDENDQYYVKEGWNDGSWEADYHIRIDNVTHWMPLPAHPNI